MKPPETTSGLMGRLMKARGQEIREARMGRGWSQAFLAEQVGTTQQTVDRIEKGEVNHTRWLAPLQNALGIPHPKLADIPLPASTIQEEKPVYVYADDTPAYDQASNPDMILTDDNIIREYIPVYPIILIDAEPKLLKRPADYVVRPAGLLKATHAYAFQVFDDLMEPALRPNDVAFVNPYRRPSLKDQVILLGRGGYPRDMFVGTLVGQSKGEWHLIQHNPDRQFSLSSHEWPTAHVIVGRMRYP